MRTLYFTQITDDRFDKNIKQLLEERIQKLKELPQREIILALDPDTAGKRGTYKIRKALQNYKIIRQYDIPEGKDINDLTEEEFKNLAELF